MCSTPLAPPVVVTLTRDPWFGSPGSALVRRRLSPVPGTNLLERLLRAVPQLRDRPARAAGQALRPCNDASAREILKNDAFDRLRSELGKDGFAEMTARRIAAVAGEDRPRRAGPRRRGTGGARLSVRHRHPLRRHRELRLPARQCGGGEPPEDPAASLRLCTTSASPLTSSAISALATWPGTGEGRPPSNWSTRARSSSMSRMAARSRRCPSGPSRRRGAEPNRRDAGGVPSPRPQGARCGRHAHPGGRGPNRTAPVGSATAWSPPGEPQGCVAGLARPGTASPKALGHGPLSGPTTVVPVRLGRVRPSMVETALAEPRPGWIRGFRMADPVIIS